MKLDLFDFHLPPERIAVEPARPRESARLLHITHGVLHDHHIADLPYLLRPDDVLVFNDSKVIPARLYGLRDAVKVEALLHKRIQPTLWRAFARPAKRLKIGQTIVFGEGLCAQVMEKFPEGDVLLDFAMEEASFLAQLERYGQMPLPPYIARPEGATTRDAQDYQTCYARHEGSVAAPTAGLHYTPALLERLRAKGIALHHVTLHVGAGTFQPVKAEDTADHVMHSEWGFIDAATAQALNTAKRAGRRIIAVGTTALRVLESATDEAGTLHPFAAETAIFITPGYDFRFINALMTNFHLPKSTLFMLVSALAGLNTMHHAYAHAIAQNYRFYSYGDACLIEP